MKTKEQKRIEATQRHHNHLKRILEVGKLNYLNERLSKLRNLTNGKSFSEKKRLMKQIELEISKEDKKNVAQMPTIEAPEKQIKKSKGGK